jgi:hypothetical protein
MKYVYSVVRFTPDPARGEFINIGAIVGSDETQEWQVRQVSNLRRAVAIDEKKSLYAATSFLVSVERSIEEFERAFDRSLFPRPSSISESWLAEHHRDLRNIVQVSEPFPVLAGSIDDAMDTVFSQCIVDPAHRTFRFRKRNEAIAALRRAYFAATISPESVLERIELSAGDTTERIDFAIRNGDVVQLSHAWSFQIPDQDFLAEEVKAWGWTLRKLRDDGADLVASDGTAMRVSDDVELSVVYIPPKEGQTSRAFDEARSVFAEIGVDASSLEEDGATKTASIAKDLLRPH